MEVVNSSLALPWYSSLADFYKIFCKALRQCVLMSLHQTTTLPRCLPSISRLYVIMFLHQTTTYSIEVVDNQKETIDFSNKKWLCRQYFHANILKKFQLNGFKKSFFLYFASSYILWLPPKIINTSKLFICYTKNTHFSCFW